MKQSLQRHDSMLGSFMFYNEKYVNHFMRVIFGHYILEKRTEFKGKDIIIYPGGLLLFSYKFSGDQKIFSTTRNKG